MKKIARLMTLMALVMALLTAQLACAEPDDVVKGIFDALLDEDSSYSANKAMYMEYFPGVEYAETLADDGFTIAVSGSEAMDGSWTFTRDGDYLTATFARDDVAGAMLALSVIGAVGDYYDMNTRLIVPYVNGLAALDIENENFISVDDEAAGTSAVSINIAGPWDMKELDEMAFEARVMSYDEPLGEESISMGGSVGRMMMVVNGSKDDATLVVGEYGGLDDLAYRSIINIVSTLQPDGWEDFVAAYTGLSDAATEDWTVILDADSLMVSDIIYEASEDYSYALIRFGDGPDDAEEGDAAYEAPDPAEAPSVEAFEEGYFDVILGIESGTAGASLKVAAAASEVCAFAEAYELYNPDVAPMRDNMLAAFEALDADAQALFWDNFESVRALLDGCLEDYEANRAVFDDAGVAEAMDEVMYDPLNRLAWENLRDHTLTMGNDMNAG